MIVELIGCTGAGKSYLTRQLLAARPGLVTGHDFVLRQARLGWVRPSAARRLLVTLLGLAACAAWGPRPFLRFAFGAIRGLPVGTGEKLKLARITARNAGIDALLRRLAPPDLPVLADEGTLQTAHYLFVHVSAPPDPEQVSAFLRLVPRPDAAVYLRQPEEVLVERTLRRGHGRVPPGRPDLTARFVGRAVQVMEQLAAALDEEGRLITLSGQLQAGDPRLAGLFYPVEVPAAPQPVQLSGGAS